jgi:hypothetical protein
MDTRPAHDATRADIRADTAPGSRAALLPLSLATPLAALGALLVLAGDAYHLFILDDRPTQAGSAAYTAHGLALMSGLLFLVLAAISVARPGRLTQVAVPALVAGTALVVGDIWAEVVVLPGVVSGDARALLGDDIGGQHLALVVVAFGLFAVGWLLFALTMRTVAGPVAWVLVAGSVIAFLPVGGSYVSLAIGCALVIARAAQVDRAR